MLDQIQDNIREWLDTSETDADRIERIEDLLHLLGFEKRLAELTPEEREAMVAAGEPSLSPQERARLDAAKSEKELEALIEGYARANYFRRMAWLAYLNGETPQKPSVFKAA